MWMHLLPALAGIWLMASPAVLDYADPARANDRIIGPIVASLAIIALWEIARPLRWVNVILGAWLRIVPWLLGHTSDARWNSLALAHSCSAFTGERRTYTSIRRRLVVVVERRAA